MIRLKKFSFPYMLCLRIYYELIAAWSETQRTSRTPNIQVNCNERERVYHFASGSCHGVGCPYGICMHALLFQSSGQHIKKNTSSIRKIELESELSWLSAWEPPTTLTLTTARRRWRDSYTNTGWGDWWVVHVLVVRYASTWVPLTMEISYRMCII